MTEDPKRRNPNQRSYHLDDETVALLDAKAQEMTVSQSAVVRMAIRAFCGGKAPAPVAVPPTPGDDYEDAPLTQTVTDTHVATVTPERQIVLPPENVSEFRVQKQRDGAAPVVQQRRPRNAFEDDGY